MTITEIARLAGVSPRAVRHYHRVGALPEPARQANGYRDYGLADLVNLLNVRRMVEAGVPLRRIAEAGIAQPRATNLTNVLEDLREQRRQLDLRIRRLEELATQAGRGSGAHRALADLDHQVQPAPGSALAALLQHERHALAALEATGVAEETMTGLEGAYGELMADPVRLDGLEHLAGILDGVDEDCGEATINEAADLLDAVVPVKVTAGLPPVDLENPETAAWLDAIATSRPQRRVFEAFLARRLSGEEQS